MINSETFDSAMSSETADNSLVDLRSQNNIIAPLPDNQATSSFGSFKFGTVGSNVSSTGFSGPATGSVFGSAPSSGFGVRKPQSCFQPTLFPVASPSFNVISIVNFNDKFSWKYFLFIRHQPPC